MLETLQAAADQIFDHYIDQGKTAIRLATPLGIGKPNQLLNIIYDRVKADARFTLDIYTALSLDLPQGKSDLEKRFLGPFVERQWGQSYPRLRYLEDLEAGDLPERINLHEFYVSAGAFKANSYVQRHYLSLNYTHVARNIVDSDVDLILQLVARRGDRYSLSGNTDLTLDLYDLMKARGKPLLVVGVVHPELPFLGGDAIVPRDFFGLLVESPEVKHKIFAVPREAVSEVDTLIGLHASGLVEDGGTLQIGIGSLSDSLVNSLIFRHTENASYRRLLADISAVRPSPRVKPCTEPFKAGLYGTSELVMDGFMNLRRAGILKRTVKEGDKAPIYIHGAFALGSSTFYDWLRGLEGDDFEGFAMTRVSKINDLYDPDENALRRQRVDARFFNTCMQVTLLGAAASETLENGTVVSGVGGQYNFVAMAHELENGFSILMLRSAGVRNGVRQSNIVWSHGNSTIPRHLRDVVITEYGVAFLRGLSDEDVIVSLLSITDSAFQEGLLSQAKACGKVRMDYEIPPSARNNSPKNLRSLIDRHRPFFSPFPFGSDFTEEELRIAKALLDLKGQSRVGRVKSLARGLFVNRASFRSEIKRMGFHGKLSGINRVMLSIFLGNLKAPIDP